MKKGIVYNLKLRNNQFKLFHYYYKRSIGSIFWQNDALICQHLLLYYTSIY